MRAAPRGAGDSELSACSGLTRARGRRSGASSLGWCCSVYAAAGSSTMSRVRVGSTLTPGPIVRRERDRADVAALGGRRLGADQLLDHGRVVLQQRLLSKFVLPITRCTIALRSVRYSTLPDLDSLDRLGDVHRHGPDLGVRHLARRAEDPAEPADDRHQVGGRDRDVEVVEALLDPLGQVLGTDDVGAGLLGLARLVALGEDGDLDLLAEPVGQRDRAAQLLVGVADVEAGADVDLDRLVELGRPRAA